MSSQPTPPCANCHRLQKQVNTLQARVEELHRTILQLQEELARSRKNSSNSSKPPSSDLVKPSPPPPPDGEAKRKPGGQPGHPLHQRLPFPPELLNGGSYQHAADRCPTCQHPLEPSAALPRVVQQVEILSLPLHIEEHRSVAGWCPHCQQLHYAPWPEAVARGGLVGPRLATLIAYLKGACHASFSTIRKFLRDVLQLSISRGQLAKVVTKVSQALDVPYQELLDRLPAEFRLHADETGHPENGERWWTWCFRAALYTLFKIDATRSGDVLLDVLGEEFSGVLHCDYFSAYRRYMRECNVVLQFCLAHLIRDVKFLTTLPDARTRAYGERLREGLRQLFTVIHRREQLGPRRFQRELEAARDQLWDWGTTDVPPTAPCRNMAKRFEEHGEAYFEFVTTPAVDPTNNLAEQAIRFVVLDRQVTQGTRGEKGRRWCERIWTVIATCGQQGRSVFAYLYSAVRAWFHQTAAPSLVGNS